MILEVQFQIFRARPRRGLAQAHQRFNFQKIQGDLNINIFCENWHETSFYIKEHTQFFFERKGGISGRGGAYV